ncbi:DUF6059 family protein [Streptomyces griseofuscus]|uniref:Uncharacterized protein n=1 Tax=Streptomyces griseofuscus TaxID=146922 RepID=A0A3R8RGJ6_9ACTN|nr:MULTISPECIES: DUF6059 family protein [Streptomyces]MBJ6999577.1 hypothetical protein [Streptomyces sp. CRPSP2-6A1]MYQ94980.1 hypothetical protein [Streptomyces sp. SID4946]RRQ88666.1 hypothetical protein CQW44_05830 [Streptomyces griseofuscus]SCF92774.1 hypothetical protein GA0115256_134224 [Streptomyces sp. DconLS]SCG03324.1 hypothetical protein GA0115258_126785 [Streptomyces sp. LamerLS-31b]
MSPATERSLAGLLRPFTILGAMYGCMLPTSVVHELLSPPDVPEPRRPPGAAHPEKIVADLPLSAAELGLARQLRRVRVLSRLRGW